MLTINRDRFLSLMSEQANVGATPDGGLSRPALSGNDVQVRKWFRDKIESENLAYAMDGAGNQTARLESKDAHAKTLLIGSHLDSVPNGGRFDGALGVTAAFEALLTIRDKEVSLPFHLEVINFTDEEGTNTGLLGSRALTGQISTDDLQNIRGGRAALEAGLAGIGLTVEGIPSCIRDPETLFGYIEVHIEQGTRLEEAGIDIGVVNSIVGIQSHWLTFTGEAAHAGTMPMNKRRDAFWGAATFALSAREAVVSRFHPGVVNVGNVKIAPAAFNIVPQEAKIALEFRHGDNKILEEMKSALFEIARETASSFDLLLSSEELGCIAAAPMSESIMNAIEVASHDLGLSSTRLLSFAGHDAQSMARVTNSAMFFVPSVDGISHNPREYTIDQDCINAANVMLNSILVLANGG